jgi:predicted nucleotidyltransferase component of viral defense system
LEEGRLKIWEILFQRALEIIDAAQPGVFRPETWSFGGGTVLMRRYRHRFSKDIDIFVPDPQYLGHVTPRLNTRAEELASNYDEQANFVKIYFHGGEIDFVATPTLTSKPVVVENIAGRDVSVEASIEILAKKLRYRAAQFTSRDIFDFALVAEKEPEALQQIRPLMREQRDQIMQRIKNSDRPLRTTFSALDILDYKRDYDTCVSIVTRTLTSA